MVHPRPHPGQSALRPFVSSLTPQAGVSDEEFYFEFCRNLEALLRGVNGHLALAMHEPERALELLDRALAVAGESTNAQIDALRSARARALSELDQPELGIESYASAPLAPIPPRRSCESSPTSCSAGSNAGAELGRQPPLEARTEMLQTLRLARADETDPQREQSTYNLFAILDFAAADERERAEGSVLLDELLRSRSGYQRQWYVRRAAGVRAWRALEHAHAAGDEATAKREGAEAGRWYSRAIRARPRIQVDALGFHWPPLRFHRVPPSPIFYANAYDGHHWARSPITPQSPAFARATSGLSPTPSSRCWALCARAGLVSVGLVGARRQPDFRKRLSERDPQLPPVRAEVERMLEEAAEVDERAELRAQEDNLAWRERWEAEHGRKLGGRKPTPPAPDALEKAKINTTDPDSRPMRRAGANTLQGYDAQVLVSSEQVIVAANLTQSAADAPELAPMVAKGTKALQAAGISEPIGTVLADGGYWNAPQIAEIRGKGIEVIVPPAIADAQRPASSPRSRPPRPAWRRSSPRPRARRSTDEDSRSSSRFSPTPSSSAEPVASSGAG